MDKFNKNIVVERGKITKEFFFKISFHSTNSQSLIITKEENSKLGYYRMEHLNFQSLVLMIKKNMVKGIPYIKLDDKVCKGCIFGKQHKDIFSDRTWKAREHITLVHSDLCGPMETMSFGKENYFLTFIDDYSRKTWVHFLQEKSEVFSHFLEFKRKVV